MKIIFATTALAVATVLTACSTTNTVHLDQKEGHSVDSAKSSAILPAYTWTYQPENASKPIVLSFSQQRISIYAGCNTMGSSWSVTGNHLIVKDLATTLMGCPPELAKQEHFASQLFANKTLNFSIDQATGQSPILTLKAADGQSYKFVGTATPETKYQSQGETIFWEVSPETKPCTGVAPQQCLQVREIKYDASGVKTSTGDWQLFYGNIEGFKHNPELRTVLRLKRFTIANPAADQSKYAYVHDMTVEQEIVK